MSMERSGRSLIRRRDSSSKSKKKRSRKSKPRNEGQQTLFKYGEKISIVLFNLFYIFKTNNYTFIEIVNSMTFIITFKYFSFKIF